MNKKYTLLVAALLAVTLSACNKSENNEEETKVVKEHTVKEQAAENASESKVGGITVDTPFIRESFAGKKMSSAFFTLTNHGSSDIEVVSASSDVAKSTEFHTMDMKDSKMIMRKMDKVIIPANGTLELKQGSDHLMLIGLEQGLISGDKVNITLKLSNGETFEFSGQASATQSDMAKMSDKAEASSDKMDMKMDMKEGEHHSDVKGHEKKDESK